MAAVLAEGAAISIARMSDGTDVVTFYPTAELGDAVFTMDENGLLEVSGDRIEGAITVDPPGDESGKELSLSAQCP